MTLVVARAYKRGLFILADTRTTLANTRNKLVDGIVKSCIVNPELCVSFSNSPDLAKRNIGQFRQLGLKGFAETVEFFRTCTVGSENEYLLAFAGNRKIIKIQEGEVLSCHSDGWIGSYRGFRKYREHWFERKARSNQPWTMQIVGPDISDPKHALEMTAAFEEVRSDSEIDEVGDFQTLVGSQNGKFRFLLQAQLFFDGPSSIVDVIGRKRMIARGENRGYVALGWAPKDPSVNACAFHFAEPKLTVVFRSTDNTFADKCDIFRQLSSIEVCAKIRDEFGFEMNFLDVRMV